MTAAIECFGLTKRYPDGILALDSVDVRVEPGSGFGLVGENGAGKSTLVALLMGFTFPTSGSLKVLGHADVQKAHRQIGYVPERQFTDLYLTTRQYLDYLAQFAGLQGGELHRKVSYVLGLTGLEYAAGRRMRTYSKGMLQRLNIAQALLGSPDLVILDEPTSGLDPAEQREVRDVVARLRTSGVTVLLCSHYLPEIEEICDSVGILARGKLIRTGRIDELRASPTRVQIVIEGQAPTSLLDVRNVTVTRLSADVDVLEVDVQDQERLLQAIVLNRVRIRSLNPVGETLEQVYLREVQLHAPGAAA